MRTSKLIPKKSDRNLKKKYPYVRVGTPVAMRTEDIMIKNNKQPSHEKKGVSCTSLKLGNFYENTPYL